MSPYPVHEPSTNKLTRLPSCISAQRWSSNSANLQTPVGYRLSGIPHGDSGIFSLRKYEEICTYKNGGYTGTSLIL